MKTSIVAIITMLLLGACANGANEEKGTETTPSVTPSSTVASDTAHADTMMQPNGVSNGTVTVDSTNK